MEKTIIDEKQYAELLEELKDFYKDFQYHTETYDEETGIRTITISDPINISTPEELLEWKKRQR